MMRLSLLICLICFMFNQLTASKIYGNLEPIDYETLFQSDNKDLENKFILLAVVNENARDEFDNRVDVLNELKKTIENLNSNANENQISLNAMTNPKFIKKFGIFKYPQFLFFRKGNFVQYKGELTVKKLINWVEATLDKKTHILTDGTFEHDTQASTGATTGDWFVLFHNTSCTTKLIIEPIWEQAAIKLENQVNFAYVDINKNSNLQKRFFIFNTPTLIFFKQGLMYRYDLGKFDMESLVSFTVKGWYKNVKSEKIPIELSLFDTVTDSIVKYLKEMDTKQTNLFIGITAVSVLFIVFIVYLLVCKRKSNKDLSSTLSNIKID